MYYYYKVHDLIFKTDFKIKYLNENNNKSSLNESELVEVIERKRLVKDFPDHNQWNTNFIKFHENECFLKINNIVNFHIKNGRYIYWEKANNSISQKDLINFLITSAINIAAIQKGKLLLNASTLFKGEKVISLIGQPNSGKNTISLILQNCGWRLIANEVTNISDTQFISIGNRNIRLWLDTQKVFNIPRKNLENVRSNIKRYYLKNKKNELSISNYKLKKVYFIGGRSVADMDHLKNNSLPEEKNKINLTRLNSEQIIMLKLRNNIFNPRCYRGLNKEEKIIDSLFNQITNLDFFNLTFPDNIPLTNYLIRRSKIFKR